MTAVPIQITVTEELPYVKSERMMIRWHREAFQVMGDFWHKKLLPKHFKINSRTVYQHRGRTRKYTVQKQEHAESGRKWRRTGESVKLRGRVDNVLTGNLRRRLQSPQFTTVKAFPSRVTIKMLSIDYAPQRQRSPKQPDKIAEIFTNTEAEKQQLSKIWFDHVMKLWRAFRQRKVTKTK